MMTDVSLRDLFEEKFNHLDRRISELKDAIEKLAGNTVPLERFETSCKRIRTLEIDAKDMDTRLDKVESYIGVWRYIGSAIVFILLAIIVAWLKNQLGV